jgi:hypothetical protein
MGDMAMSDFEGNYVAIVESHFADEFSVEAFFSNHKSAFVASEGGAEVAQSFRSRGEAQDHAENLVKEFDMGSQTNPVAILHLNRSREVMYRDPTQNRYVSTGRKVDLL